MDTLLLEAVEELEYDRSEVGSNIKMRVSDKIMSYIKSTRKYIERT